MARVLVGDYSAARVILYEGEQCGKYECSKQTLRCPGQPLDRSVDAFHVSEDRKLK